MDIMHYIWSPNCFKRDLYKKTVKYYLSKLRRLIFIFLDFLVFIFQIISKKEYINEFYAREKVSYSENDL